MCNLEKKKRLFFEIIALTYLFKDSTYQWKIGVTNNQHRESREQILLPTIPVLRLRMHVRERGGATNGVQH